MATAKVPPFWSLITFKSHLKSHTHRNLVVSSFKVLVDTNDKLGWTCPGTNNVFSETFSLM